MKKNDFVKVILTVFIMLFIELYTTTSTALEANNQVKLMERKKENIMTVASSVDGKNVQAEMMEREKANVITVAFSVDGKKIQAVMMDGAFKTWELNTGKLIKSVYLKDTTDLSLTKFSNDGMFFLTCSDKKYECKIFNTGTAELIAYYKKNIRNISMSNSAEISNDRKFILYGDDYKLILWDIKDKRIIKEFRGHKKVITSVAISNDGKYAASGSFGSIKLWSIKTGNELHDLRILYPIDVSGDIQWITYEEMMQKEKSKAEGVMIPISALIFSPNGNLLASGGPDGVFRLWDARSGNLLFTSPDISIISASFSPDNKYLLTGGLDKSLILWDVFGLIRIREFIKQQDLTGYDGIINAVTFSQDGKYVLSGSDNGMIKLWDVETGKEIRMFK